MREILFRGKRKDNGEWVEGSIVVSQDRINYGKCYMTSSVCDFSYGDNEDRIRLGCFVEVIPDTVCQFTGLRDKNGKKIFEGDIVNQNRNGFDTLYVTIFTDKDVGGCGCCYPSFDGIGFVFESVKGTRANIFDLYPLEVVGNIHDNKEMLTGQ